MNELTIELAAGQSRFEPGETIRGTARWRLDEVPDETLEVRLFWYTEGKGELDVELVETVELGSVSAAGSRDFSFSTPAAPLSFSGKLISLVWAIEVVALPDGDAGRQEIMISHTGDEIRIGTPEVLDGGQD
ncbi:MAG: hypothetical protein O7A04_04015 [Acidobacteria bacterium]|nr:hypothetical protein [Acidobacteriota bacterium]